MTNTQKGWFERQQPTVTKQGIKNKAPVHHKVAVRRGLETTLRVHMVKSNERKPYGYWTPENTLKELKEVVIELNHFPTHAELIEIDRNDLSFAIRKNGGVDKFRLLLGYELFQKSYGYWTPENTLKELKEVVIELNHFPTHAELIEIDRNDLSSALSKNGGIDTFRTLLGYKPPHKPDGYWTHENVLKELKEVIIELGHFPTRQELEKTDRNDLIGAMNRNGGAMKFRTLLGYELLQKPANYWTPENTLKELKEVIIELGHFPTRQELKEIDRNYLVNAITKNVGWNKVRTLMDYDLIKKTKGYWTHENVLKELNEVITKLGHFPTFAELKKIDKNDLIGAITKNGGIDIFRTLLGNELPQKIYGYWTHENILKELKEVIIELGHFPTRQELKEIDRNDLNSIISKNGGIDKFRKILGYPPSLEEFIGLNSYVNRRGFKSEKEVKKILLQYCKQNGRPEPAYNKKLAIGNVIEFVCGGKVGIDVTNTKSRDGCVIRRKYLEKDYYKYLDKLWIVVLSDVFTTEDYIRFNEESPNNVEIMSVWDLIDTLQVDIDEHSRRKLGALETCTLRTKNDLINNLKNRTLVEYT